ncbi:MAG: class I tRNA ligase family protein, partial [archaeon]|nr:class I tRNA ligase family protein [archaeon]
FTWEDLETKVNTELVAALGNFYHRCLSFTHKNFGEIPANDTPDQKVTEAIEKALADYNGHLSTCDFKKSIQDVMALAHFANEYFNSCMPWKLIKEDKVACGKVLNDNLRIVKALCTMAWPFMPKSSEKIWGYMGLPGSIEQAGLASVTEMLPAGTKLNEPLPVYGKIDLKVLFPEIYAQPEADVVVKPKEEKKKKEAPKVPEGPFGAFRLLDLRVGQVVKVEDHPDADKLYKLTVDLGEETGPRTICAGLKAYYTVDEMLNRKAIVVSNLAPRPLRGVDSCGMLLAADDEALGGNTVCLLKPSKDVPVGTRFNCGLENNTSEIDYKKHFATVTMKVTGEKAGILDVPADSPAQIAMVYDGENVRALTDGNGTVAMVERPLKDGAGVR